MSFFFVFVFALFRNTSALVGYMRGEVLLFFAFMNTIDVMFQLTCRGLMLVPAMVRKGEYDTLLTKPVSPFFLTCFKLFDFMDLGTFVFAIGFLAYAIRDLPYALGGTQILIAAVCWICSFVMAVCLNILIAALSFWTTEIENGMWIYRDLVYVGRFPPEIYPVGIRKAFTYVLPILLIVSTPTLALIGRVQAPTLALMLCMTAILVLLSRFVWLQGLKRYTSASA